MENIENIIVKSSGFHFRHTTNHEWNDISSEEYREYIFPGDTSIRIEHPQLLAVSNGGHRVATENEQFYIPFGWVALKWKSMVDAPHFVK